MFSFPTKETNTWVSKLFEERFGHKFYVQNIRDKIEIKIQGIEGAIVFNNSYNWFDNWDKNSNCLFWNPKEEGLKSYFTYPLPLPNAKKVKYPLLERIGEKYFFKYDLIGFIYWTLNRIEEINNKETDKFDRYPGNASYAFKNGYLNRPIIDEWFYIIAQIIQRLWPTIKLKSHQFSIDLSHDVDFPSLFAFNSWKSTYKMMVSLLFKEFKLSSGILAPYVKFNSKKFIHPLDPYNKFDWLMDKSEDLNIKSTFNFFSGITNKFFDANYNINNPLILKLIKQINNRGHELGLHPSFDTYKSSDLIILEANRFKKCLSNLKITQELWGGRMHYLRWKHPYTLKACDKAGLNYDSTLGFADNAGFRCGTSFEYPAFDPVDNKNLNIRIRPLIIMENTILDGEYMGYGISDKGLSIFLDLKKKCEIVKGTFSLLWHNSNLTNPILRSFYERVLTS